MVNKKTVYTPPPGHDVRQPKATADDLDLSGPVELVALSVKDRAARCRLLGSDRVITLRASRLWKVVPGEIVTVKPRKQWSYAGHPYLSGEIESTRLDVAALGLVPLRLEERGMWDPQAALPGVRRTSRSRSGPSRSSPAGRAPSSRWSRCCLEPIPMIRSRTPSSSPTISRAPATAWKQRESSWSSASPTCVASMPTRTSAISSSTAGRSTPSATTRSAFALENCPSATDFDGVLLVGLHR